MLYPIRFLIAITLLFVAESLVGQSEVLGSVVSKSGDPIIGANVFIEGSYDGTVTEVDGSFSFTTDLSGQQTLLISYLGYESQRIVLPVVDMKGLEIKLRESASTLDAVEINASTFKAGDNSKLAVLKPIDMVTTAGSMGDVIAAIQTLPGTQSNSEDGRLFVRGGDANETKIYIDGMRVFSPYLRTFSGTPTRGRYSPFLFKGTSFSTGGYDTNFGQALSGVLDMSTIDKPNQTETNISLMTVGLGLGHTQKGEKQSVSLSTSYIDLTPYYLISPTRLNFDQPFRSFSGELVHRLEVSDGLWKNYVAGDAGSFSLKQNDLASGEVQAIAIKNSNIYTNSTYNKILDEKTSVLVGFSFGQNFDDLKVDSFQMKEDLRGMHTKLAFKTILNDFHLVNYGAEYIHEKNTMKRGLAEEIPVFEDFVSRGQVALFGSTDYFFSKDLALKVGLRAEYNSLLNTTELDPRMTIAYKLGQKGQMSAAYGRYNQEIGAPQLYSDPAVVNEKSTHYLLNYNYKKENTILRLETYYKSYDDLVTYDFEYFQYKQVANNGSGTAYGIDLFYRTDKLIKYIDMWISYSWLHNERQYKDYPTFATPGYSTDHNLSVVTKKWFPKLNSSMGLTYTFASGRPYDNRNSPEFMTARSGSFHNVSFSWAYLITQQKILFASVSNAPGFRNEFGYRYADTPNSNGIYNSELIRPNDDRFFFVGFFITMSDDGTKNQLDNL